ncbi:MAG TPA: hypothetical protein DDX89_08975 [Candidatus Omnitrophica bacterium]|nr:MAG: hypothetical protein A3B73_04965 [Omnitrophica WOR_2 bacterium RIFCSPHIGHO2_02_FULL_63_39]OGX45158.1 MAG: hypothetical protein A3I71_04390 [Omnitrophica WOR_2 bacterium RIFCSPLOWO2_02_FULL_63_16]OGX49470.1 MAG: hypothetical protein A3G88_05690 [Omnitrophica WOR_2 bacterium RIFCSPLOWO2_12_FULL_63_16]HBH97889.1 hypothetical protein [Candidatus Omnitrophota bacterium]HBQ37491.1 hypothetical protein [Candidatus Omnitrophota bacterium]
MEIRGEWILVDGEPFLVKGVGYSPYRPGQRPPKSPVSLEVMASDFQRIREGGFNTIRTWAPLSPEQLALAHDHGLMVLQGLWIDQHADYGSASFQAMMRDLIHREAKRAMGSPAVLAFIVGNELSPHHVYTIGLDATEGLLRLAARSVKELDPARLVSYANWPELPFLDHSMLDVVSFNVYPYKPANVSHSFGFRGYVEHLKRSQARDKPLLITEVGLSASPQASSQSGYGGLTPEAQARQVLDVWDAVFQARAQGACVFEWNDEWWKQGDRLDDESAHDPDDPEEWFGMQEFASADQLEPTPRPLYHALKAYNQAIVLSPVTDERYHERVPVSVYATEAVAAVRVRVGKATWQSAAHLSVHWWKAALDLPKPEAPQRLDVTIQALDRRQHVLAQQVRRIWVGGTGSSPRVLIRTDQTRYEVGEQLYPMAFTIRIEEGTGQPRPNQLVHFAITELPAHAEVTQSKRTNDQGELTGSYLLREAGVVMLSAGTAPDEQQPLRRVGAERLIHVVKRPRPPAAIAHQPSRWESRVPEDIRRALRHDTVAFHLADEGAPAPVDYEAYGTFHDAGTSAYRYEIRDAAGLAKAVGEGISPNEESLLRDPAYRKALEGNLLDGTVWDFVAHDDVHLSFLKWASTVEQSPGVKLFFTARALERAGLLASAVKAYHAILVHFPDAVGWTEFQTPWYVGPTTRDTLETLLRLHPELGLRLEGARVVIEGGFDNDVANDVVIASPGRLVRVGPDEAVPAVEDVSRLEVVREIGKGRVRLRQYANRHWQLLVDGNPMVIRAMSYQPSAVGESPDEGTLKDWMTADRNQNGKPDGPFDTFVDANHNHIQDPEEPTVGDFHLMHGMGVNVLRLYHHASNKALLRRLYEDHGIMALMGDLVGMYTVGSGATWEEGTDYLDPTQRRRMTQSVKQMVREFKNEPYILMWVLGNENNYGGMHGIVGGRGNAARYPKEYYAFLNELATWIHREDPNHPVAVANGEWLYLDLIAQQAPAIDVFGANVYRGEHGFGSSFFEAVREVLDKPVLITEFGCPAYQARHPEPVGELGQALYHLGNWIDLDSHLAGRGAGNALGGVIFAWVDEWWKAGQPPRFSPWVQDTTPNWSGPFPGGKNYEEWFGITSQGDGSRSPYLRQLRAAYRMYHSLWKP